MDKSKKKKSRNSFRPGPDINIQISENTKLQIRSNKELFLKFGSLKVLTKTPNFESIGNDGSVFIGAKDKPPLQHILLRLIEITVLLGILVEK